MVLWSLPNYFPCHHLKRLAFHSKNLHNIYALFMAQLSFMNLSSPWIFIYLHLVLFLASNTSCLHPLGYRVILSFISPGTISFTHYGIILKFFEPEFLDLKCQNNNNQFYSQHRMDYSQYNFLVHRRCYFVPESIMSIVLILLQNSVVFPFKFTFLIHESHFLIWKVPHILDFSYLFLSLL